MIHAVPLWMHHRHEALQHTHLRLVVAMVQPVWMVSG